jgi:hypothetical protein
MKYFIGKDEVAREQWWSQMYTVAREQWWSQMYTQSLIYGTVHTEFTTSSLRIILPEELEDPLDLALKPLPNVCGSWHHPS